MVLRQIAQVVPFFILLTSLVLVTAISAEKSPPNISTLYLATAYHSHESIEISSDSELALVAGGGSGNKADPYILEGLKIITKGVHGIYIHDTTKCFIIRNCWIETGSNTGIFLRNLAPDTTIIRMNICKNNRIGICVSKTDNTSIQNNDCNSNSFAGIAFGAGEYNGADFGVIRNNTCSQNYIHGIYLDMYSDNCTISWNLIANNFGKGFHTDGDKNVIHHNSFIDNEIQAISQGQNTRWYDLKTSEGNYWSDWKGSGMYQIDKWDDNDFDPFPLERSLHEYSSPLNEVNELLTILGGVVIVGFGVGITYPRILCRITKENEINQIYFRQIKIAFFVLMIQNALIVIPISFIITLHLDLVGFYILGTGLILYAVHLKGKERVALLISGLTFIIWVILRVIIQYILPFGLKIRASPYEPTNFLTFLRLTYLPLSFPFGPYYPPTSLIAVLISLGGVCLAIGTGLIWITQKERSELSLMAYGILNLLTISLIVIIGVRISYVLMKGVLIPILGLYAFFLMWRKGLEN